MNENASAGIVQRMTEHLRIFLKAFLALTLVGLSERVVFAVYHHQLADQLSAGELLYALAWGLRFDAALAAILAFAIFAAAHLVHRFTAGAVTTTMRRASYPLALGLVALHGADLLYFSEAGRHMGYELRDAYASGNELFTAAVTTYPGPVLLQLALMVPAIWLVRRLLADPERAPAILRVWRHLLPETQLFAALVFTVLVARGGIQNVPLEPLHAQALGNTDQAALALNGAYNSLFFAVTGYSTARVMKPAPTESDWQRVRALYSETNIGRPDTEPKDYNVVFVFLESWSGAFVSSYGQEQFTTPVFDELRRQGLTTRAMIAGGQRTTEGMFTTLCSAQNPLGNTVARGELQNYGYRCLPHLLRESGYETAFFQGTVSGTSGTGAFAQLLGFENSYGKEHMDLGATRYELNSWGVHDPDLYDFALDKMRTMRGPFLVGINTNSTHDGVLPEGVTPAFEASHPHSVQLNTMHFADHALGEFIEKVKNTPEIGPTLFVLVSDHTGPHLNSAYYNVLIPFAIVGPGVPPQNIPVPASQRDIAPTLLALLGRPVPPWFSGQSLLDADPESHFADFYQWGHLGWIQGDLLQLIPLKGGKSGCFDYGSDPWLTKPIECPPEAAPQRRNAVSFARVSQELLFRGNLRAFAELRASGVE